MKINNLLQNKNNIHKVDVLFDLKGNSYTIPADNTYYKTLILVSGICNIKIERKNDINELKMEKDTKISINSDFNIELYKYNSKTKIIIIYN